MCDDRWLLIVTNRERRAGSSLLLLDLSFILQWAICPSSETSILHSQKWMMSEKRAAVLVVVIHMVVHGLILCLLIQVSEYVWTALATGLQFQLLRGSRECVEIRVFPQFGGSGSCLWLSVLCTEVQENKDPVAYGSLQGFIQAELPSHFIVG